MSGSSCDTDESDAIEAFQAAGLGQGTWGSALERMAALTGSHRGQLIGFDGSGAVQFNWVTATDPQMFVELEQAGGNDARVNSRIRVGLAAPVMAVLDEASFDTEGDGRRFPAYGDHLRRWDAPFLCLTTLTRDPGQTVGLSLNRRAREGHISEPQKEMFRRVALHARQAVRTQTFLGEQAAGLISGALESLSLTCLICTEDGRVLGLTAPAEDLLVAGDRLRLRQGRLAPAHGDGAALAEALANSRGRSGLPARPVVVHDSAGARPLALEISPLPFGRWPSAFDEAVLVAVREPVARNAERAAMAAAGVFQFTPAETVVAAQMLSGRPVPEIAGSLGIGAGTVRTHIRRLYEKAGAKNQLMFAAILSSLH